MSRAIVVRKLVDVISLIVCASMGFVPLKFIIKGAALSAEIVILTNNASTKPRLLFRWARLLV
jgi:hypothetical protein